VNVPTSALGPVSDVLAAASRWSLSSARDRSSPAHTVQANSLSRGHPALFRLPAERTWPRHAFRGVRALHASECRVYVLSRAHSSADERASATRSRAGSIGAQQPVGKRRVPRLIETRPSGANPEPGERSEDHHRRADYRTRRCTGRTRQPSEPLPRVRPSHKGDRSCRIACASARADLPRPARWSDDQTARRKCQYG
jgi:hypothetical protein